MHRASSAPCQREDRRRHSHPACRLRFTISTIIRNVTLLVFLLPCSLSGVRGRRGGLRERVAWMPPPCRPAGHVCPWAVSLYWPAASRGPSLHLLSLFARSRQVLCWPVAHVCRHIHRSKGGMGEERPWSTSAASCSAPSSTCVSIRHRPPASSWGASGSSCSPHPTPAALVSAPQAPVPNLSTLLPPLHPAAYEYLAASTQQSARGQQVFAAHQLPRPRPSHPPHHLYRV
jgi:hypothetical protein